MCGPTPCGTGGCADADETRHVRRVLRLRVGDLVPPWTAAATSGRLPHRAGSAREGEISTRARPRRSPLHLTLAQGLSMATSSTPSSRAPSSAAIVPLLGRSVPRAEAGAARRARWERVARRRPAMRLAVVPTVAAPRACPTGCWARPGQPALCPGSASLSPGRTAARAPSRAAVVIGPEGGLADDEVTALQAAGAIVAGLGPRLLRTETAGPVAVALLQAHWGDLGTPNPRSA
jgi:16S rRNA (uracil1498-N3)-methyltransferase